MVLMPCKVMMWTSPCPCGPCISSVSLNMTLCFLKGQDTRGETRIISFRDHDGIYDDFQVTHISNMEDVHSKSEYFQISLGSFYQEYRAFFNCPHKLRIHDRSIDMEVSVC